MSYQAEKDRIERKIRIAKTVALGIVLALVVGLCVFSAFCSPSSWKYYVQKPSVTKRAEGDLRIHFLDVGQGDCTLIELPDGKVALIDGADGMESSAKTILRYMNALKIKTIDFLIVTHTDKDHCGALAEIIRQKTVLNAYLPAANPENEGETYAGFYQALLEENCVYQYASRGVVMADGEYDFRFLYPYKQTIDAEEPYKGKSCVIWLDYKGVSTLLTGDATAETEQKLVQEDELGLLENCGVDLTSVEILKLGHHGSNYSSAAEFLQYIHVKTAVASCGENNLYGHPADEVVARVEECGAELYRTDKNGTVMITVKGSDGYAVRTEK